MIAVDQTRRLNPAPLTFANACAMLSLTALWSGHDM